MEYVKIGSAEYPATISGRVQDSEWGGRPSKTIKLSMSYADAESLFRDGVAWSIIIEWEEEISKIDEQTGEETKEIVVHKDEFDNSDYNLAGPILDMRNGTVVIKMGKPTELEEATKLLNILTGVEA